MESINKHIPPNPHPVKPPLDMPPPKVRHTPKRYKIKSNKNLDDECEDASSLVISKNGNLVDYQEYTMLQDELEAFKRCWNIVKDEWGVIVDENIAYQSEIEKLKKELNNRDK